jgi:hypothetical protein
MYDHDASDGASGAEEDGVKRDFSPANDPDIWPHDNIGFPDRFAKGRRLSLLLVLLPPEIRHRAAGLPTPVLSPFTAPYRSI